MTEMDQENKPDKDDADFDDELASLSADEKAAFEKIMAEISAATGSSEQPAGDPSKDSVTKDPAAVKDKGAGKSPDAVEKMSQPQEAESSSTEHREEASISADKEGERHTGADTTATAGGSGADAEALDEDQQATLNQIMADIEGKSTAGSNKKNSDQEELPEDQQATLDAIMSEINSKRKGEPVKTEALADEQEDTDKEELSEDQQAALDAIMSEINSKRKGEPVKTEALADEQEDTDKEELSEDQQAALDAIMSEISKRKGEEKTIETVPEKDQSKAEQSSLTIEEFDDELSNLLTEATPTENKPLKTPSGSSDVTDQEAPEPAKAAAKEKAAEYPILQEVPVADKKNKQTKKAADSSRSLWTRSKRRMLAISLTACLILAGGYGSYRFYTSAGIVLTPFSNGSEKDQSTLQASVPKTNPASAEGDDTRGSGNLSQIAETTSAPPPKEGGSTLKQQLLSAKKQIQAKIADINQLKSYYARGIEEEKEKIEQALEQGRIPSFSDAMADKKIELALRAIQRRQTYIAKLETPVSQLTAMAEELLYLERRADIFAILANGINGLPTADFEQDAITAINSYLQYKTQLSIDQVEVDSVDLSVIWNETAEQISKKANLLAQRAPLNRAISKEICKGNYERKYQLTALSPETASCLIQWPGKDLYLNALNELPPEVAKILSQWPGEWISMNGIKELSAESAKYLSAWPGRRLSLNGLTELSPEATAYLSQWQGEQLEMVGLHAIGSWKNYGTRLFLSEKLRWQLEAQ